MTARQSTATEVRPLRGVHFNPEHVSVGTALAPPYDVISAEQQERLYGSDLRNIVRIDYGMEYPDDVPGESDRYTRATEHLRSWLELGILVRDERPSVYVSDHEFPSADGETTLRRRGLFVRVPALPWDESPVRPHERTLRGPKEDRMALMRATRMQSSPVFAMWDDAPGIDALLEEAASGRGLLGGRTGGEVGEEKHVLWRVDDSSAVTAILDALRASTLYIADGHHRYETAVAYAQERRAAGDAPDADSQFVLLYLCAADDPSLVILPTHRLLRPRPDLPYSRDDLWARLDDRWEIEPMESLEVAVQEAADRRASAHAVTLIAPDGIALLSRPRSATPSPRAGLDVTVLQEEVIAACGIDAEAIREGALAYARNAPDAERAVHSGEAGLAFVVNACTSAEVMAVADAGETMPQKSTYFYPKVPTGLVLSPL